MEKTGREKAIKDGFFDARVQRSGVLQVLRFKIVREKSAAGIVPFIVPDRQVDLPELLRVCEEMQLPLKCAAGVLVPKGRMLREFAGI